MGLILPIESITVDNAVQFLLSDSSHPRIQVLLLLYYHLIPTTAHSPNVPAASITAASTDLSLSLPPRKENNEYIVALLKSAINAAVQTANRLDSVRPCSGYEVHGETYPDGTSTKVTIEWARSPHKNEVEERKILQARCLYIAQTLDCMSENDARLMIRILSRDSRMNSWQCACGSGSLYRVRTPIPLIVSALQSLDILYFRPATRVANPTRTGKVQSHGQSAS
jgi:hypothetical protein